MEYLGIMTLTKEKFSFQPISEGFVRRSVYSIGLIIAVGRGRISAKMRRLSSPAITAPVTILINKSLEMGKFPDQHKEAQFAPVHKKNRELDKSHFRPVSVLTIFSKGHA